MKPALIWTEKEGLDQSTARTAKSELHDEQRGFPRRRRTANNQSSLKEEEESMNGRVDADSFQEDQESFGVILCLTNSKTGKESG